jgi:hypothetical protein
LKASNMAKCKKIDDEKRNIIKKLSIRIWKWLTIYDMSF